MAVPIPGFYFDVDKNRYFKIRPYHRAPDGLGYSADEIERRNKNPIVLDGQSIANRAPTPVKPLGNRVMLLRELGLRKPFVREAVVDCWASELVRRTLFYAGKPPVMGPDITHFVKDDLTGIFSYTLGTLEHERQFICGAVPLPFLEEELEEGSRDLRAEGFFVTPVVGLAIEKAPISSLCLSPSRVLLVTHVAQVNPAVSIMPLWDPPEYIQQMGYLRDDSPPGENLLLPTPIKRRYPVGERVVTPAWSSAANPFCGHSKFAVGLSDCMSQISGDEDTWDFSYSTLLDDAIFSVDWLDHNTMISGGRRGEVALWDTRNGGQSMRFQNPAQINHVRKLEGTRVAVAGTNESIHIQDLRILPRPGAGRAQEPYMTFHTSGGPVASHMIAGFDVHGDLIAAATGDCRVQLFNVGSGKEVRMKRIEQQVPTGGLKRCVKFAEDEGQMMKLYVASQGSVQEWSWA